MIKKLFLGFLLLSTIAIVAIYMFGSSLLNKAIKGGVEKYGPMVTQTDVTLQEVDLSILSGQGTLTNLNIGNPDGYKSADIFALGEVDVNIDIGSIFSDKIIIEHIIIRKPAISYEKTLLSSNVKELLENIEEFTGVSEDAAEDPQPGSSPEKEGAKQQVVIKKLLIEDGAVYVGAMGVGQEVALPKIELYNLGEGGNTASIAQVSEEIISAVLKAIGPAIADAKELLKKQGQAALDEASKGNLEGLGDAASDAVDKASESIKGLFGK